MDHSILKDQLFALYDGELDPASRRDVEAHLAGCRECRESYDRWVMTTKAIFQVPKPATSEFFVRTVMNRIHELESPRPVRRWDLSLRWLVPAIGMAFALFLAIMPTSQTMSMDNFLFQEMSGHLSWVYSNRSPNNDETLQFIMGETQ